MNPLFAPIPQAHGGLVAPDHLANFEASPALDFEGLEGPQVCQQCGKQFARTCDLNKHLKTHIRPFKCPVEDCKYHLFGWPTEKELDRHYNDKHSKEPRVYSCLWQDCNYTSKRESNCKQHMEKTHGYNYVRSRPSSKEEETSNELGTSLEPSHLVTYPRSNLTIRTVPGLTLSPSEPCLSAPQSSTTPGGLNGTLPYGADVYDPWASPVTMSRDTEGILESLTPAYAADTQVSSSDAEWLKIPVDPRLYNTSLLGDHTLGEPSTPLATPQRGELLRALPHLVTPKTSPVVKTQVMTPLSEPSPAFVLQPYCEEEGATPQDAETDPGRGTSTSWALRSGNTGRLVQSKRQVRFSNEPDDDSERDEEPPRKRARAPGSYDDDLGDRRMPCPFRVANPEIYDLNHDPKYLSCHTEHTNISTVVRHLGRPAHNLDVDNGRQSISSFNVADNEHGHPAAGLCKKCWRAFSDPVAFENHFNINAKCENVSRSKREKFDILLNTFCRTDPNRRQRSVNDDSEAGESQDSDGEAEDVSVRSNRTMGDSPVRRSEFLALVARVQELERAISQGMSQATPRIMPAQTDALVSSSMGAGIQPSRPYGHYTFDTGAGPSTSRPAGLQGGIGGIGGIGPGTVHYGNMAGFGQDTARIVPDFNPSVVTRSGGMPSNHGPQPVTVTAHHSDSPAESSTGSSTYRSAPTGRVTNVAAAVSSRGGGRVGAGTGAGISSGGNNNDNHHNNNTHNNNNNNNNNNQIMTRAQAADYGHEAISQESVNTAVRNRWYQAAEASDAMLQNISFFDAPVDDVNFRFLDMDSQ